MRSRNLKPGFFDNELLAECDPLARILFEGLWCYGDREGRFEWRPKRIKVNVLPYDECDIKDLLDQLWIRGFILKYPVNSPCDNGEVTVASRPMYGLIPNFTKHASPHHTEKESDIPPPPSNIYQYNQGLIEKTVNSRYKHGKNPPDSLNPDSLNPESLKDKTVTKPTHSFQKQAKTLYENHPRKGAKEDAIRNALTLLRKGIQFTTLRKALDNYIRHIQEEKTEKTYIIQANNFWGTKGRWRDFVKLEESPEDKQYQQFLKKHFSGKEEDNEI